MNTGEFILLIGTIISSFIIFSVVRLFIYQGAQQTLMEEYKTEAKDIVSSISSLKEIQSVYARIEKNVSLCNLTIENGTLTYEKDGHIYVFDVPLSVENVKLLNITSICIAKKNGKIFLLHECPKCNLNSVCEPDECISDCPDCYGPSSICIGDGYCNVVIGENCVNSADCTCEEGTCCPDDPLSDNRGCENVRVNLKEGEECYCDSECSVGLKCNPTTKDFSDFSKACCPPGKSWNGSTCIVTYCSYPCQPRCKLPEEWDWSHQVLPNAPPKPQVNWMSPVRNQGHCGSCWAFSAVGTVENTYNVENSCPGCNKDLSEQELISCCDSCGNCNGGYPWEALDYIERNGIVTESCFPYTATNSKCKLCKGYKNYKWYIRNYKVVSSDSLKERVNEIKRSLICNGPLSVSLIPWPGTHYGHAVVLVGYSDKLKKCDIGSGDGCWIIRNSWGSGWGHNGYATIAYGVNKIEDYAYYVMGVYHS